MIKVEWYMYNYMQWYMLYYIIGLYSSETWNIFYGENHNTFFWHIFPLIRPSVVALALSITFWSKVVTIGKIDMEMLGG